jgi:hypothetical protein
MSMDREAIEALRIMLTAHPVGHTLTEEDESMDGLYNELCDLALEGLAQPEGGASDHPWRGALEGTVMRMGAKISELEEMLDRIANAYGSLPQGKKEKTRAVGFAVNAYLNYRRAQYQPQNDEGAP